MNYINKSLPLAAGGVGGQGGGAAGGGCSRAGPPLPSPQAAGRPAKVLALCRGAAWIVWEELSSSVVPFRILFSAEDLMKISISSNTVYR